MTKTKSRHHKSENKYKFLTFNERLALIKVDVTKRIVRVVDKPEETETYFFKGLEKWIDLNYTSKFSEFTECVRNNSQNLAQIVYHKDFIFNKLLEHISQSDVLSLQPFLDLTVQLSRDLEKDFYPYFPRIFEKIVNLLETQDTNIIEWAFQCLSYLFKFLWRSMLDDFENVYSLYSPLFDDSRKVYIRNYAAESFAYIMRKVNDKEGLFDFMLTRLKDHPEESHGIGQLIFEMLKGVQRQFHSCADTSLIVLLNKLNSFNDIELDESSFKCINQTIESMAEYTKKEHSSPVWNAFYAIIDENKNRNEAKQCSILTLIRTFISYQNGYLVNDLSQLVDKLCKLSEVNYESNIVVKELLDTSELLLMSENVKFPIDKIRLLIKNLYQVKFDFEIVSNLTREMYSFETFQELLLPFLLNYSNDKIKELSNEESRNRFNKEFIKLSTDYLLTKHIISTNSNDLFSSSLIDNEELIIKLAKSKNLYQFFRMFQDRQYFNIDFKLNLINYIKNELRGGGGDSTLLINILIVLPFILNYSEINEDKYEIIELVGGLLENFLEKNDLLNELNYFIISILVWSLVMMKNKKSLNLKIDNYIDKSIDLFVELSRDKNEIEKNKCLIHLLRSIDYLFGYKCSIGKMMSVEKNDKINSAIVFMKHQLSSPYHESRLISLNILAKLLAKQEEQVNEDDGGENVLTLCIKAEKIKSTIEDYRQKLYFMQRLDFNNSKNLMTTSDFEDVPLRYFLGALFENFQLIWDPITKLIESYANGMPREEFWNIYGPFIENIFSIIEAFQEEDLTVKLNSTQFDYEGVDYLRNKDFVDYVNARFLIITTMQGFADLCETRTKFVVPLLFRFLNNEYYKEENKLLSTVYEDISRKDAQIKNYDSFKKERYTNKKTLTKHLCAFLEIFSKFKSPGQWYKEEDLRSLFLNLLCHYESKVQSLALKCLLIYKYEYLDPYKDHLGNLLIGKHFRHEIVVFSLDETNGVIKKDHRERLLPVLMRVLYGKFHSRETTHTSSRDTVSNKRTTIIQFLSSCSENEINKFFELIFNCLLVYLNKNNSIDSDSICLKQVIPLKKLIAILQTLQIIISKLAKQMKTFSHQVLKMLCFTSNYVSALTSENRVNSIEPRSINLIKILRQNLALRFKEFFQTFDEIDYDVEELCSTFTSYILPQIPKLQTDCLKSVNNLIRLFLVWSEQPRFYSLFVFKPDDSTPKCILDYLFDLMNNAKCSSKVIDQLMNLIFNLVTYSDFDENENKMEVDNLMEEKINVLPIQVDIDRNYDQTLTGELNFGTIILKPYSNTIINHIEKIVIENMSKKELPPKPLKILARLSSFAVNSKQQCEKIIRIFIPYLIKNRKQSEENEVNILNSINHLLKQVTSVVDFVSPLSRLFSILKNRSSRVELCNIFETIKTFDESTKTICDIVINLNAMDRKRLEEPDYFIRLDAFKHLNAIVRDLTEFDEKIGFLLIYNCCFFLNNIDDLAIRESSTNCMLEFIRKSITLDLTSSHKQLFESNLINEIKSGLRNFKSENARHDFISLFLNFIRLFENMFPKYKDLLLLCDKEDIERDFYENITHIQMHRRSRALKKLQRACNEHLICSDNLLSFMMPIVKSFLDNEIYHKYDYLIEEASNSIGAICYCLNWQKYYKTLDYYLKLLTVPETKTPKIIIKIVVSILDAFHYDLSSSGAIDYFTEKVDAEDEIDDEVANEETTADVVVVPFDSTNNVGPTVKDAIVRKKQQLSKSVSTKVHSIITKQILPLLFKCIAKKTKNDEDHKVNKKLFHEDEHIVRVPIVLAILKLLNNLPKRTLETHLPGLVLKVCEMLKSRAISVRQMTRECLIKMVDSLEKRYYFYIFKELSNSLTRGYQLHVLCFTIQILLKHIQPKLSVGDLDSSLANLSKVFHSELFSDVSDEKDVKQIVAKIMEAKTTSSYNSYEIISKYISQNCLLELIKPLNEELESCKSRKILKKIEEALRRIMIGLLENSGLNTKSFMLFIYGLINESFDSLSLLKKKFTERQKWLQNNDEFKSNTNSLRPINCLIIPKEPTRGGEKTKVEPKTNQHVIIEFALQLLNNLLKQNKLLPTEAEHVSMLEPYTKYFTDYLDAKYIKVTIIALRCLTHLLRFKLASFKNHNKTIAIKLFQLLRTFAGTTGEASTNQTGDNFDLMIACFKVISTMIRDCEFFELDNEHLQILLHYVERNLHDSNRQASAFNLLKAIFSRKLECTELTDVVAKVMKLSIQSESSNVRLQSRQTIVQFMLDYSLGTKKLEKYLEFYIVQLNYEYEDGRESALEMLATIFQSFPLKHLNEYASLFFVPLAIRLNNDESSKCKKLTSLALKSLIEKISIEHRNNLFSLTKAWFDDDEKVLHKRLGALLMKLFVEIEKEEFENRLNEVMPILSKQLNKEHFEKENGIESEKITDQYLVNLFSLLIKIISECKLFASTEWSSTIYEIFDQAKHYLRHDHTWVQLSSSQLFGLLFSNYSIDELVNSKTSYFNHSNETSLFLKIRDLIDGFSEQFKSPILENALAEQIIKNLAYMAKMVIKYPMARSDDLKHDLNIQWMIKKLLKEANFEMVNKNKQIIKRTFMFKWLAAVALELGKERVKDYLGLILPPLQREIVVADSDENLKKLSQEVLDLIKQLVGVETFSDLYSISNKKRSERRDERKRKMAQIAITEPQVMAIKKINRMQKKKEAKKRKMENYKKSSHLSKKRKNNFKETD